MELSVLTAKRKSSIEVDIFNNKQELVTESLDFEYKSITPLVLRHLDKIQAEVEKFNKENKENKEKEGFELRSSLIEQLSFLLTGLDVSENGVNLEITITNLEKVNINVLEAINQKIFSERMPTKKTLSITNDSLSEVVG